MTLAANWRCSNDKARYFNSNSDRVALLKAGSTPASAAKIFFMTNEEKMMMALPDTILVVIPAQQWDSDKYMGINQPCYIEEQLLKQFPDDKVRVVNNGFSYINGIKYEPEKHFDNGMLRDAFSKGDGIEINLLKTNKTW